MLHIGPPFSGLRKNLSCGENFPYDRLSCGEVSPHDKYSVGDMSLHGK